MKIRGKRFSNWWAPAILFASCIILSLFSIKTVPTPAPVEQTAAEDTSQCEKVVDADKIRECANTNLPRLTMKFE